MDTDNTSMTRTGDNQWLDNAAAAMPNSRFEGNKPSLGDCVEQHRVGLLRDDGSKKQAHRQHVDVVAMRGKLEHVIDIQRSAEGHCSRRAVRKSDLPI